MDVGFHEPGERFEVDEVDRGVGRWVCENGLETSALLPVARDGALGV